MRVLTQLGSLVAVMMMAGSMPAQAAFSDQDDRAFGGTIACGGNHFFRMNGTEAHNTRYVLRNYGDIPVRIEQMTMYDANGNVLLSANGATLPTFRNGVLGAGDNSLNPNETALLASEDVLSSGLASNARPIQLVIEWAADRKTLIPDFVWVRNAFRRGPNGAGEIKLREQRARHLNNCRSVRVNEGRKLGHDRDDD